MTIKVEELLFNDEPITINRKLAKCLGLKEAAVFQQIHYWLKINEKKNNNYINGRYWTYNSLKNWHEEEFDFLSVRTLERTLQALEKEGLLITDTFNKMKGDKTKWYTINYDKLVEVAESRLIEKEELSKKRRESGKKGITQKLANASKKATLENTDPIQPNWQNGASNQIGRTIQPNWQNHSTKLAEPIPKTSTKTSTETSSSSNITPVPTLNLKVYFEKNICKLGTSTERQFNSMMDNIDKDLLKAIIDYQESINTKSFAGFKKGYDNFISVQCCKTVEDLIAALKDFRQEKVAKNISYDIPMQTKKEVQVKDVPENAMPINDLKETIKKDVEITDISFKTWIEPVELLKCDKTIYIIADSEFEVRTLNKRYKAIILKHAAKYDIENIFITTSEENCI